MIHRIKLRIAKNKKIRRGYVHRNLIVILYKNTLNQKHGLNKFEQKKRPPKLCAFSNLVAVNTTRNSKP